MAEIKDFARMCSSYYQPEGISYTGHKYGGCSTECPLNPFRYMNAEKNMDIKSDCRAAIAHWPDLASETITEWCKEHPQKTYLQDFLEKFPGAATDDGVPAACRADLYGTCKCHVTGNGDYTVDCRKCWDEVVLDA